jgi:hypothetical protein
VATLDLSSDSHYYSDYWYSHYWYSHYWAHYATPFSYLAARARASAE